jgi:hypothetical protein
MVVLEHISKVSESIILCQVAINGIVLNFTASVEPLGTSLGAVSVLFHDITRSEEMQLIASNCYRSCLDAIADCYRGSAIATPQELSDFRET